jgi:Raf kinase inhibitor-like YbhB/YbcL family protein
VKAAPLVVVLLALGAFAGCGGSGGGSGTELEAGLKAAGFEFTAGSDVAEGQPIESRFTCDGTGDSPTLRWKGVPEGTSQLALVLEDPDAPGGTFTHWLLYGLDPAATDVPAVRHEGWTNYAWLDVQEGENDLGNLGYGGPCPPGGEEHRYVFRLLALDVPVELEQGADRAAFDEAVAPHVLAEARLTAPYARG